VAERDVVPPVARASAVGFVEETAVVGKLQHPVPVFLQPQQEGCGATHAFAMLLEKAPVARGRDVVMQGNEVAGRAVDEAGHLRRVFEPVLREAPVHLATGALRVREPKVQRAAEGVVQRDARQQRGRKERHLGLEVHRQMRDAAQQGVVAHRQHAPVAREGVVPTTPQSVPFGPTLRRQGRAVLVLDDEPQPQRAAVRRRET